MNREIYPAGLYPLEGDVLSIAGNTSVQVVGIIGIPVQQGNSLFGGEFLMYDVNTNQWIPTLKGRSQVNNGLPSDAEIGLNTSRESLCNGV